ncbi:hypothetical protein WNY37_18485 [Henriciella sp. AS95]|uniref:hypothetical protein n=1 Tax=Henriciella sp. AS95 TaxID=3135782 RepID=UPI00317BC29E
MKLYHFTAISHMKAIMSEGLTKGEMPVSATRSVNAVNFTTDKTGVGHGLCRAKFATPGFLSRKGHSLGVRDQVPMFADKHKVRITVDLDRSRVTRWMRWAKSNVEPSAMTALIASGGGTAKARTWYFANRPICPTEFEDVEVRQDGRWVDILDYEGPLTETITDKVLMDGYAHWGRRLLTGLPKELGARLENLIEHQDYIEPIQSRCCGRSDMARGGSSV